MSGGAWPPLPVAEWSATRDTLQLWTQVVGKVRMASTPLMNHWWNVPLYVSARGLTTSLIPHGDRAFQIDLDLVAHRLDISVTDGAAASMALVPRDRRRLPRRADGAPRRARPGDADLDDAGRDPRRHRRSSWTPQHATYDAEQAHRFWLALVQMTRVFEVFRSRYVGKVSPVHLFWGALDLAVTRFSGRPAPPHPGGAPNCGPHVMHEAYSHEVSSAGYWPGPDGEGVFYSYAYPAPDGFADAVLDVPGARYDDELGEFVAAVRGRARRGRSGRAAAGVPPGDVRHGRRPGRLGPGGARTAGLSALRLRPADVAGRPAGGSLLGQHPAEARVLADQELVERLRTESQLPEQLLAVGDAPGEPGRVGDQRQRGGGHHVDRLGEVGPLRA